MNRRRAINAMRVRRGVEKDKVSDANSCITSLKKKNSKMAKKAIVDEEIAPQVNALEVCKLTKQLESSEK